ncbi:MAG: response regulator [Magnetococcales bacterium]|nr:response regulator [Magnetococcales bacterium]NGZ07652.1 response regulator [Magnetococcales bacterium]
MTTILCVEDDAQLLALYRRVLEGHGFKVLTAGSGQEGLKQLHSGPIDLVITDMLMPEMDGVELILQVLMMQPRPLILAVSGGGQYLLGSSLLHTADALGVQGTLLKPFTGEMLVAEVFKVLHAQH